MRPLAFLILVGLGCQDPSNTSFRGDFRIKLVDAPAIFDAVNIVVRRVSVHRAGASAAFGWTIISEEVRMYDLLGLRNGVSATLASASLPAGRYDKIRILFGTSSLVEEGFERTVLIPADLSAGSTIDETFDVEEGRTMSLTFDFNVAHSIRSTNDGRFELRPKIRTQRTDLAGSIAGGIVPDSVLAIVTTIAGTDSVSTYSLSLPGLNSFQLVDLPEGTYQVGIHSTHAGFLDTLLTDVMVVAQQTTPLGAIVLRPRQP